MHRADYSRRSENVWHGLVVSADRHLLVEGPALRTGRSRDPALLQRGEGRTDTRGGHNGSRFHVIVHRRRHSLRELGSQYDSLLFLLLDVRVSTDWRLDLGGGRQQKQRISPRRNRR